MKRQGFSSEAEWQRAVEKLTKKIAKSRHRLADPTANGVSGESATPGTHPPQPPTSSRTEQELYPLLGIDNAELTPEQLREKRRQQMLKNLADGRRRAREQREQEQRARDAQERQQEELRARCVGARCAPCRHAAADAGCGTVWPPVCAETPISGWRICARDAQIWSRSATSGSAFRPSWVTDAAEPASSACASLRSRCARSVCTPMAGASDTTVPAGRGRGGDQADADGALQDTFGMDDADWQVYRDMVRRRTCAPVAPALIRAVSEPHSAGESAAARCGRRGGRAGGGDRAYRKADTEARARPRRRRRHRRRHLRSGDGRGGLGYRGPCVPAADAVAPITDTYAGRGRRRTSWSWASSGFARQSCCSGRTSVASIRRASRR